MDNAAVVEVEDLTPGYASAGMPDIIVQGLPFGNASMRSDSAGNIDVRGPTGDNGLSRALAELSALNLEAFRKEARRFGVSVKDEGKKWRTKTEILEDCRLALEAQRP